MGQSSPRSGQLGSNVGTDVSERIITFLRRRYPTKTAECVAAELNVSEATAKKWLSRMSVPSGLVIIRMVAHYGPEFLAATMSSPPKWLDAAARAEEQARIRASIAALQLKLEG